MVDVEVIKRLVELMVENELAEVSIRDGEEEISLKKAQAPQIMPAPLPITAIPHLSAPTAVPTAPAKEEEEDADDGLVAIPSPMVGTFYAAPDPSSPPYAKVGDPVSADTVVCIIEAMKVFNEIKAGVAGTIERTMVSNETAVEYDQPLFMVRPA